MNQTNFIFTPENVSKYWNLLNYSNNPNDKKQANDFIIAFKKNCSQCLEISIVKVFDLKGSITPFKIS